MICSGHIQRGGKAVAGFLSAKSREFQVTRIEFSVDSIRMLKIEPQLAARRAAFALSPLGMLIPILPRHREHHRRHPKNTICWPISVLDRVVTTAQPRNRRLLRGPRMLRCLAFNRARS